VVKRRSGASAGLDLVPVMNLLAILVPFLLTATQLVGLAVVDTVAASWRAEGRRDVAGDGVLPLRLRMTLRGFSLDGADDRLDAVERVVPCRGPCPEGAWDYAALRERLGGWSERLPPQRTIVLVPDAWVSYAAIVETMDALRDGDEGRGGYARVVLGVDEP
jgi:biopolymer transport protein ExbD